jgi:nucleoid-associated protein YgaU
MKKSAATYAATLSALQKDYDRLKSSATTPRAAPVAEANRVRTHTVRAGETLKSIAASRSVYGDSAKWILLYQANKEKIRDPNKLTPGQVLVVPPD